MMFKAIFIQQYCKEITLSYTLYYFDICHFMIYFYQGFHETKTDLEN